MSNFNNLVIPSCEEYEDFLCGFIMEFIEDATEEIKRSYDNFCVAWMKVEYYHNERMVKNNGNS